MSKKADHLIGIVKNFQTSSRSINDISYNIWNFQIRPENFENYVTIKMEAIKFQDGYISDNTRVEIIWGKWQKKGFFGNDYKNLIKCHKIKNLDSGNVICAHKRVFDCKYRWISRL